MTSIEDIFNSYDSGQKGYLSREDLAHICQDIDGQTLKQLFEQLDRDSDGVISKKEFMEGFMAVVSEPKSFPGAAKLQRQLTIPSMPAEDRLLPEPKLTRVGRLRRSTRMEFVSGSGNSTGQSQEQSDSISSAHRPRLGVVDENILPKLEILPCQDDLLSFHEALQETGVPDELLDKFQKMVAGMYKEMVVQKQQNEQLVATFQKEKDNYSKQVEIIETELDQQLRLAEEKARAAERERLEKEKEEMRRQMENEISELQANIKKLQRMEMALAEKQETQQKLLEMKSKLHEKESENRSLRACLIDTETNMALTKAEMAKLQQEYEEKCMDLMSEKETMVCYINEQDNMTRQLQLLCDANKQLHDTNDSLRIALETKQTMCKKLNIRAPSPGTSRSACSSPWLHQRQDSIGSLGSASIQPTHPIEDLTVTDGIPEYSVSRGRRISICGTAPTIANLRQQTRQESIICMGVANLLAPPRTGKSGLKPDSSPFRPIRNEQSRDYDDLDSGLATRASRDSDSNSDDVISEQNSTQKSTTANQNHFRESSVRRNNNNNIRISRQPPAKEDSDSDQLEIASEDSGESDSERYSSSNRRYNTCSTAPATPLSGRHGKGRRGSAASGGRPKRKRRTDQRRPQPPNAAADISSAAVEEINSQSQLTNKIPSNVFDTTRREPERTFKVVMAGDASVGKSSFVMRLCKDAFITGLPSTIGVDYHVKSFNVDGKHVAIQLWDTAGQERFRSVSKSYFRRADGIVMLYDVIVEQTFLNVRNWMETVHDSITRSIPIIICGNKIDLRVSSTLSGFRCVKTEEGAKLARTYGTLFIETSAREGTNVNNGIMELAREMLTIEDVEVKSTSLVLKSGNDKPKASGCGRGACSK